MSYKNNSKSMMDQTYVFFFYLAESKIEDQPEGFKLN